MMEDFTVQLSTISYPFVQKGLKNGIGVPAGTGNLQLRCAEPPSITYMANSSWIETKRDAEYDESGKPVVKKVQLEPAGFTGKSKIDLALRIIGLAAIVIPIVLVYLQQKASLKTQKAIKQLEVYSQTASELSSICRRPVTSAAFVASKDELLYTIPPKVAFLFSDSITRQMETINAIIPVYEAIVHNTFILDSVFIHGNECASMIGSYAEESSVCFDDSLYAAAHIKVLDSCRTELIYWFKILQDMQAAGVPDTNITACIKQMLELDNELLRFCSTFCANLRGAFQILISRQSPLEAGNRTTFALLRSAHKQLLEMNPQVKAKYKTIKDKTRTILEARIYRMQAAMRKTNDVFQE